MAIYDCIIYFDEDLIVDMRLNILNNFVDKFVIVEATRDHAGRQKRLNFNINNFKKFRHKILYHVVEDIPEIVEKYKKSKPGRNYTLTAKDPKQRGLNGSAGVYSLGV